MNDLDLDLDFDPTMADLFSGSKSTSQGEQTFTSENVVLALDVTPIKHQTVLRRREVIALDTTLPFFFPHPDHPANNATDLIESRLRKKFYRTESS